MQDHLLCCNASPSHVGAAGLRTVQNDHRFMARLRDEPPCQGLSLNLWLEKNVLYSLTSAVRCLCLEVEESHSTIHSFLTSQSGRGPSPCPWKEEEGRSGESHAVLGVPLPGDRWSPLNGESWKPLSESTPLAAQVLEMLGSITKVQFPAQGAQVGMWLRCAGQVCWLV